MKRRLLLSLGLGLGLPLLGLLLALLIFGGVKFFGYVYAAAAAPQRSFYAALESGDPTRVRALLTPELDGRVTDEQLAAWRSELGAKLGSFQDVRRYGFQYNVNWSNGVKTAVAEADLRFAQGRAHSVIMLRDDRVISFTLTSPRLAKPLSDAE